MKIRKNTSERISEAPTSRRSRTLMATIAIAIVVGTCMPAGIAHAISNYTISFQQTGNCCTQWSVGLAGLTWPSSGPGQTQYTISITVLPGQYSYTVNSPTGLGATPASGVVDASQGNVLVPVTFAPLPQQCNSPTISLGSPVVQGLTVQSENGYTAPGGSGCSIQGITWSFGDNSAQVTSWFPVGPHAYANPGTYTITATTHQAPDGQTASATTTITVRAPTACNPPTISLSSPVVQGLTLQSDNGFTAPGGSGCSIQGITWSLGDSTPQVTSWFPVGSHTYSNPGTYMIVATAHQAPDGQTTSATTTVTVDVAPQIFAVSTLYASNLQQITITGVGFGSAPTLYTLSDKSTDTVFCNTNTPTLAIRDGGTGADSWSAGRQGCNFTAAIGLYIESWSDTMIILTGLGTQLGASNATPWRIATNDPITVVVFNSGLSASFTTKVAAPLPPPPPTGGTITAGLCYGTGACYASEVCYPSSNGGIQCYLGPVEVQGLTEPCSGLPYSDGTGLVDYVWNFMLGLGVLYAGVTSRVCLPT